MEDEIMLSTSDNPYDPFTQWDEWYAYDESKGYHTCSYLARVTRMTSDLGDAEEERAIDLAIDEILKLNLTGNYIKVKRKQSNSGG
jgi:hypothetical protein